MGSSDDQLGGTDEHRTLVDAVPNGMLALFDANLRFLIVGPATLPVLGADASTKTGRRLDDIYPPDVVAQLSPVFEATLDGTPQSHHIVYLDRIHRVETAPVSADDKPRGVVLTQDVTAERRRSDELTRQREQLEMFASVVSHDLRNPLAIAQGYLEYAVDNDDAESLEHVRRALSRMDEIITDLLRVAANDGRVYRRDRVAISTVAADAWEMVDTGAAALSVETGLVVDGDERQLRRLFENAFRNAVEHGTSAKTDDRGDGLTVAVVDDPGGFAIEDDGPGIPADRQTTAVRAGYTTQRGGTGFGLYIIRDVALAHGWEMTLTDATAGGLRLEFVVSPYEESSGSTPKRRA